MITSNIEVPGWPESSFNFKIKKFKAVTVFAWSSKKHVVLNYPDERFYSLCWLIPDAFHWVMLQLVSLVAVLVGINCFLFQEELTIDDSLPNPPYMQHHLLWMKVSFWCDWWWFISLVPSSFLFHIIVQYPLFIPCHNLF